MPVQHAFEFLDDLPPRPRRPERLFFGLMPNPELAARLREFGERFICENRLWGTLLEPERLHVSLQHVNDDRRLRTKFVFAAMCAAQAVSVHPFAVTFHLLTSFDGAPSLGSGQRRRPLVLLGESDGLLKLHGALGTAMEKMGLKSARHFTPHMTLFYGASAVSMRRIEPIRFPVDEFALIHSRLWLSQYEILGRWSLRGG